MTEPLVSVVIPAFNAADWIAASLASVAASTYPRERLDVIVVDDGSRDRTSDVATHHLRTSGLRHVVLRRDTAGGPPAARNDGWRRADGDWIQFLDADDLWHPEKLARQMARFQARPELDLCITHAQNFWVRELLEEEERLRDHPRARAVPGYSPVTLLARRRT